MPRLLWFVLGPLSAFAQQPPFRFEPNLGQAPSAVRYVASGRGGAVALTDTSIHFPSVALSFGGANPEAWWEPYALQTSTSSYFIGSGQSAWIPDVPHYGGVRRRDLYPGIDAALYGSDLRRRDFLYTGWAVKILSRNRRNMFTSGTPTNGVFLPPFLMYMIGVPRTPAALPCARSALISAITLESFMSR